MGNEKSDYIFSCRDILKSKGFTEIQIPVIQHSEIFQNKVGQENNNMMYNFTDRGNRDLCLAPEYTAVVQQLTKTYFKYQKDVKLFYVAECFRGEKPQSGRFRQFTQLGVEILNPTKNYQDELIHTALLMINQWSIGLKLDVNKTAKRGLDYYKEGQGFEISCEDLGSSKQICGGGEYEGGVGFAVGIDRIIGL